MKTFNPYINFAGQCREAFEFYKKCFRGEIVALQTFGEAQQNVPDETAEGVMHAEFKAESIHLMGSDGMPNQPTVKGDNISLSVNFSEEAEQETVFLALSEGGKITFPLHDTFWGARFGMLTDRFGIHWMFNCYKK